MHILQKIFDSIFPPSKEEKHVRDLTVQDLEIFFSHKIVKEVHVLSSYTNPKIRALIHEAKFHNNKKAWALLSILIHLNVERHVSEVDLIIPVPLSKKRLRERGHNQVLSILNEKPFQGICVEANVLKRNRNTQPQTALPKEKRMKNVRGAFDIVNKEKIKNKKILLVDDVMTTGATLSAAKDALLQHSPYSVICVALAH